MGRITLKEAINRVNEEIKIYKSLTTEYQELADNKLHKLLKLNHIYNKNVKDCINSTERYEQLLEWLTELQYYKKSSYPNCSDCGGCTQWVLDCANHRQYLFDTIINWCIENHVADYNEDLSDNRDYLIKLSDLQEFLNSMHNDK